MAEQQKRWNERYGGRGPGLSAPEPFLVERLHMFRPGLVLDVACGDGRHAVYLAQHGFEVTGVDFSEQALTRLQSFARQRDLHVDTYQRDLDLKDALGGLGAFDNVIVVHFKPAADTFLEISQLLRPGGMLLMTSFNMKQHDRKGFRADYCYSKREYLDAISLLEVLEYVQYADDRGYFDGYVFRKL